MIFIIVPDYPQVTSWKSIYKFAKRKINKVYDHGFSVYKVYMNTSEEANELKRTNFMIKDGYSLIAKSTISKFYKNQDELDELLESCLMELDQEDSVCMISNKDYLVINRFFEPIINLESFNIVQDGTRFEILETSIVPLEKFGTYRKEEKNHEIHTVYTDK